MGVSGSVCKQCQDYGFVTHNGQIVECPLCKRCGCGTCGRELTMAEVLGYQQVYNYVQEMTGNLNKYLTPGDAHHAHGMGIEIA